MGCCDNKCCSADSREYQQTRKEREIPDGFEPCCSVPGQRCLCLPYGGDPWLISSQILTICATFFSWTCWVTLLVSCIGFILFQLLWCVRMRRSPLLWYMVVAGLISVTNLGIAIYVLVAWRKKEYCSIFRWYTENYYSNDDRLTWPNTDYCQEKTWFAIALVCALLWAGVTFCITWFVKSGRHAKWEEEYTTKPSTEVEIITKPPPNEEAERDTAVVDASGLETEKNERGQFVCVPYDDPWPIAAQILAVVSVGFSWVSRHAFAVNLIGIGLYQILWCIRMKTASLIGLMVVAGVISSMNLGIGIFVLVFWRDSRYCEPFVMYDGGSSGWWPVDFCHEEIYFAVALVCALLWAAAMCCTIWFVTSGRHAKWQELYAASEVKRGGDAMVASISATVFALPEFETLGSAYHRGDEEAVMAVPVEKEEPVIVLNGAAAVSGVQVVAVVSDDAENEDSNSKQPRSNRANGTHD